MSEPRAQRTLVKSPPELWAEVSDRGALTRHLGELGEIRITRLDPETTVAWEGDRVRGTVELEASGWGTKVTLTAEVAREHLAMEEEAAPLAAPARAAAPLPPPPRRLALRNLFRRRPRVELRSTTPGPDPATEVRITTPGSDPVTEVRRNTPGPDPATEVRSTTPGSDPVTEVRSDGAGTPVPPDAGRVEAVLVGVLDELGSATKRPFSR